MSELFHWIGGDLAVSATGDLALTESAERGQQRVLRRLLSNAGEYIFHTEYGAGLPKFVGSVSDVAKVTALVREQILLDDSVARTPEPEITVRQITGGMAVSVRYTDSATKQPQTLSFNVNK